MTLTEAAEALAKAASWEHLNKHDGEKDAGTCVVCVAVRRIRNEPIVVTALRFRSHKDNADMDAKGDHIPSEHLDTGVTSRRAWDTKGNEIPVPQRGPLNPRGGSWKMPSLKPPKRKYKKRAAFWKKSKKKKG